MACLNDSDLQGYLEESGATPLRQMVESHMVSCAKCRAAFDRVVATHQRVNVWLSELSSPEENMEINVRGALAQMMRRVETAGAPAATVTAEDHLARLLAPDTEIPWYKSIYQNVRELVKPEKLPPLELTSKPVAVRDIWGQGTNPKAFASSLVFQGIVVAILFFVVTDKKIQKKVQEVILMAPPPPPKPITPKANQGGGGGSRSPLPPLKAELPKPAPKQYVPPLVTIEHPALTMDASLIAPPDAWAAPTGAIGNPLGQIGGGGGFGSGGGIGNGRGNGIGNGNGSGNGGGSGGGIYSVGNGVTAPTVITRVDPEYSEEARKAKYSGSVQLSIVVNTNGKATDIKVTKSLGMGLDEKAVEAIQKWVFKPGTNQGKPVNVRALVEVNFRLL
jgi:TonB family protein